MASKQKRPGLPTAQRSYDLIIISMLVVFRAVNALAVKTFFQPDEYFQSLEPAWQAAFGSGSGAWVTWVGIPMT